MATLIKWTPNTILLRCSRVNKPLAILLFSSLSVVTLFAIYQMYSHTSTSLPDIQPTKLAESCPTLHIAMIIVGYNESRSSFLTVKSIIMYQQTKLHFHFITDSIAQVILGPMMNSWLLPGVEFDFYNITEAWSSTPWRVSQLCSKELLKIAALPKVLPREIDAVVVVDPNLIITASVFDMFYQTNTDLGLKRRLIALNSDECTIDCRNGSLTQRNSNHTTPGVMVLNLAGMRSSVSWKNMWHGLRNEPPDCEQVSSLASLESVRKVCATLKCDWNTYNHLSSPTLDDCWANISVFEHDFKNNALRRVLQPILDYNGYQLRFNENDKCYHSDPELKQPPSSAVKCSVLQWEGAAKRRIYPYFLGCKFTTSDPHDVTLVAHLTLERMNLIEIVSKHWDGPMSLAIQVTDSQVQQVFDFVSKSEVLSQRNNIAYHLLFKISPSYPINPLRILGHKFVTTPYVFFNDIDFIPSYGLYENLKDLVKNMNSMNKTALVVPAFETNNSAINYPRNKEEMVDLMQRKLVWQFHRRWPPGHAPTNYAKWAQNTTTSPYTVTWKHFYEPYIAVKTSVLPFDPRFVSRHDNKISHNEELHMAGYRFLVVHNGFLIHMPHPLSDRSILYPDKCYENRYNDWKREKQKQYREH